MARLDLSLARRIGPLPAGAVRGFAARMGPRWPGPRGLRGLQRPGRLVVWGVAALLVIGYVVAYLGTPPLPGNTLANPIGWWGWYDQSMTLQSTVALVHQDFNPALHHYPMGYSVLGVLFYRAMPRHAFFFVDLLSLLGAYAGFVALGRRLGIPGWAGAVLFALSTLADRAVFQQWVVPWNTSPVGAFVWLLLACSAAWIDGRRRPFWIGVLLGGVLACRPSDGLIVLPCLLAIAWAERRRLWARRQDWAWVTAGAALVVLPFVALHLVIYGPVESPYMASSAKIGFSLFDFGWKAYVLFIDPYAWFSDGEGLLQHAHWIALGLAGIVPALLRGPKARVLAAVLIVHAVLYISYVDLLPTGLWRFLNVHYFVWAIPGYALLAATLLQDLVRPPVGRQWMRWVGWGSMAATLLVLCLRVEPVAAGPDQPAKAVDFAGPPASFPDTFMGGRLALKDADGILHDFHDFRGFLYPGGVRAVGLRRDMQGAVAWVPGHAPLGYSGSVPTARWRIGVHLAWPPRWLRRAAKPGIPVPVS